MAAPYGEKTTDENELCQYKLEGLCCPNCSMKIESALSKEKDIGETSINFASQTVWLPSHAEEKAKRIIKGIEPKVMLKLADRSTHDHAQGYSHEHTQDGEEKSQLPYVFSSGLLLIAGIALSPMLQDTGWAWAEYVIFLTAYLLVGYPVLLTAGRNLIRGSVFDENFLMSLATLGAIAINQMPEAVGVMLFYSVGEYFQGRAVNRSRRSIQALMDIRPDSANLVQDNGVIKVRPEEVQVGQQVLIKPGEKIPLDGKVINGSSFLDTSALTGESVPRKVEEGDAALAGMINTSGVLTLEVSKPYEESSVAKILDMVENAGGRKAQTEKFITRFARYYTPAVVFISAGIALIPPFLGLGELMTWVYRALTILVISCPCALVISIPLGYFGGIGGASRQGILIKGANYLEGLSQVSKVVFDKTGTLTEGVFDVVNIYPEQGYTAETLLETTALAESHSSHPIAVSIRRKYGKLLPEADIREYKEISGHGISALINGMDVKVGKADLLTRYGVETTGLTKPAPHLTPVYVSIDNHYAGVIFIADRIKEGARETIEKLNLSEIKTIMLTGDHMDVAKTVAEELNVGEYYGDLLPEDKVNKLEEMLNHNAGQGKVVFIGDGINDAPVLTRADIGVAMGGLGSDAAIEAADIVFMDDRPEKLLTALELARFTKKIIWQNIFFALTIKLIFIGLGTLGLSNMWEAVFADVGVALLAILNAMRVYRHTPNGQMLKQQAV